MWGSEIYKKIGKEHILLFFQQKNKKVGEKTAHLGHSCNTSKRNLNLERAVLQINSKTRCPWGCCSSRHQTQLTWGHDLVRPALLSVRCPFILGWSGVITPCFSFVPPTRLGRNHEGHQRLAHAMSSAGISTHLEELQASLPKSFAPREHISIPHSQQGGGWIPPGNHLSWDEGGVKRPQKWD